MTDFSTWIRKRLLALHGIQVEEVMKHQCVICGEPMKGDDSEVGIFQMQNNLTEHRSVPSHKQCNVRWGKHEEWKKDGTGKNEFTSEEVAEIEARMDNYPWEPVEPSKDRT